MTTDMSNMSKCQRLRLNIFWINNKKVLLSYIICTFLITFFFTYSFKANSTELLLKQL